MGYDSLSRSGETRLRGLFHIQKLLAGVGVLIVIATGCVLHLGFGITERVAFGAPAAVVFTGVFLIGKRL